MKTTNRTTHTRLPIQLAALAAGLLAWAAASAGGDGPCASPPDPDLDFFVVADNGGYEGIYGGGRGGRGPRGSVADNGGHEGSHFPSPRKQGAAGNGGHAGIYGKSGRPCC